MSAAIRIGLVDEPGPDVARHPLIQLTPPPSAHSRHFAAVAHSPLRETRALSAPAVVGVLLRGGVTAPGPRSSQRGRPQRKRRRPRAQAPCVPGKAGEVCSRR